MFRSSRVSELAQRPALQLADTVFAHTERYSNLFLCMFPVVRSYPEAHLDETFFSGRQRVQCRNHIRVQFLAIKLVFVVRFNGFWQQSQRACLQHGDDLCTVKNTFNRRRKTHEIKRWWE